MSFYSLSSYSQLRVNQSALDGGGTPSFSNLHSFSFDGIDDYFLVPDTSSLRFNRLDSFSFSAWVNVSAIGNNTILSNQLAPSTNYRGYYFAVQSNKLNVVFRSTLSDRLVFNGATNLSSGWNHVVFTYDGTASTSSGQFYINGSADTTTGSGTLIGTAESTDTLYLGCRSNSDNFFNGKVDETAIFTTELSQSDVSAIYNNGEPQSLDAYSPFVWFRMGDNATWNGATWTMTSVGTDTRIARSANMVEANRTTDVPPNPFVNTLSTYFDGVDDRVETNRTLTNGYAELSVSTWVKYNNNLATSNQYHPIVARQGSLGNSFALQNMRSGASSNGGELYFGVNTPNGNFNAFSGVVPSQNVWYNIVGTYDGSNVKIYIDGVLKATTSASGNINTNNTILYLGDSGFGGYSQILNGNLDEVSIYSRGLTQSEVTDIFGQGVPSDVSSISDIEAYWRMGDGDTANTITDNVGSNNGTMVNMNASNFVTDVPTIPFSTKSILLDGIDDYVSIPTITLATDFSVSMWVKASTSGSVRDQVFGGASGFFLFGTVVLNGGANANKMCYSNGSSYVALTPTIRDGQWHNIVITYNSSATNLIAYTDGVETYNATYNAGTNNVIDRISEDTYGNYWKGNIDEVAVWNSEINISDVWDGSAVPFDISSSNPLSWWRCGDSDTAPTLLDNGSGGNDGTMTNFTTFSTDVPT